MRLCLLLSFFGLFLTTSHAQNEVFTEKVLTSGLNFPWEITYGPDAKLWVTESRGYKLQRIDPISGAKTELLDLSSRIPPYGPQGGMMGLAIHPDFLTGKPYFYIAYIYRFNYLLPKDSGAFYSTRVSRFTCNVNVATNPITVSLIKESEVYIKDSLPGSSDHNSGRLAINLIDRKLYYSIGDMGTGGFANVNRTNHAQDVNVLEGKILRFNLEADSGQKGDTAWIPDNNPFLVKGVPTAVYSLGHRNAQGLVWANIGGGKLYSSEQSDRTDDEINDILPGKNYMWPMVSGRCDGNYNGGLLANMPANETDDTLKKPLKFCNGDTTKKQPLAILFYRTKAGVDSLGPGSSTWPTIAPASIEFYKSGGGIPNWYPSLFLPSLKKGVIYRIKLNIDGSIPVDVRGQPDTIPYFRKNTRWRDLCISPDGATIFACTDDGEIFKYSYVITNTVLSLPPVAPILGDNRQTKYVQFYPNPVHNQLIIQHRTRSGKTFTYQLSDLQNRAFLSGNYSSNQQSVDVSKLITGMYLLRIFDTSGICIATEKLLKL